MIIAWQVEVGELATHPAEAIAGVRPLVMPNPAGRGPRFERTRPNGTVLELRTEVMADGGVVRTYTDITERKHVEQAIAAARDAAEAAGRARANFLAIMNHEIRTPLNGIIGTATLPRDGRLNSEDSGYLDIIHQSGSHLLRIINDIIDFSCLDATRVELEDVVFDIREIVRDAVNTCAAQGSAKRLALQSECALAMPKYLHGDPSRLRQVLLNLIGNAVKFTERGEVRVRAGLPPLGEDGVSRAASVAVAWG